MSAAAVKRQRNPRGQGAQLRDDIQAAATELLEETGNEDAVTLRAVARRIGITAPAIYSHFPDRESILEAVVDAAFDDLYVAVSTAVAAQTDPVDQLRGACEAYLEFAEEQSGRYHVLFDRRRTLTTGIAKADSVHTMVGAEAFATLITGIENCVAAGRSSSNDPVRDATALWIALHGYATLRTNVPYFPWSEDDDTLENLVHRLARLT
ncbi:TetR/AcrR family transcriptional regulator [Pseudonocardia spinosispora]|uniref:TetR/AcrR family transcriptional regulator n=1 Tax=Pseudonocardia spinosispora TaxID=103441 RepID=UPI000562B28A|nr:TetR/AcrR family transcriptional regulator [Pseudonocardia spinosispora]